MTFEEFVEIKDTKLSEFKDIKFITPFSIIKLANEYGEMRASIEHDKTVQQLATYKNK